MASESCCHLWSYLCVTWVKWHCRCPPPVLRSTSDGTPGPAAGLLPAGCEQREEPGTQAKPAAWSSAPRLHSGIGCPRALQQALPARLCPLLRGCPQLGLCWGGSEHWSRPFSWLPAETNAGGQSTGDKRAQGQVTG